MVVVVQLVRTPDCGSGGRGFKSHHPPHLKPFDFQTVFFVFNLVPGSFVTLLQIFIPKQ